jgi:hypothetical protein
MQTILFPRKTKNYLAEITPLGKPPRRTLRMVMRLKTMCFPFLRPARVREKRLNTAWKIYVSGPLNGQLPSTRFQSASRQIAKNYMRVLGHIQCACLLKRCCGLMVRQWRTLCGRIPAVKPTSVTWRHSPSIFLLFLASHQQWIWIVSRCTSRPFSSIFMPHLSPLDAHDVAQRGHASTVAISAPLVISRLVGEVSRSHYWCASGSVQRLRVPNTSLLNASPRWSSATPG